MNRTEELRQQMIAQLEANITSYEELRSEFDDVNVPVSIVTVKRTVELLKKLEVPVEARWVYYTNDEGRARWRCSNCRKIIRQGGHDKKRCSCCGAYMKMEA